MTCFLQLRRLHNNKLTKKTDREGRRRRNDDGDDDDDDDDDIIIICLLKAYSSANRTGSPQGLYKTCTLHKHKT